MKKYYLSLLTLACTHLTTKASTTKEDNKLFIFTCTYRTFYSSSVEWYFIPGKYSKEFTKTSAICQRITQYETKGKDSPRIQFWNGEKWCDREEKMETKDLALYTWQEIGNMIKNRKQSLLGKAIGDKTTYLPLSIHPWDVTLLGELTRNERLKREECKKYFKISEPKGSAQNDLSGDKNNSDNKPKDENNKDNKPKDENNKDNETPKKSSDESRGLRKKVGIGLGLSAGIALIGYILYQAILQAKEKDKDTRN